MFSIESAGLTDVGQRRDNNEDEFLIDDSLGFYIVADGMGGHKAGEVASKMVVETVYDYLRTANKKDDETKKKYNKDKEEIDETLSPEANRILSGINLASRTVHQAASGNKDLKGMGSTASALYFTEYTCIVINVGDSPVYLVRNETIELISKIHTVLAEHEALNPDGKDKLRPDFKHVLTRAMGVPGRVKPDITEMQFLTDDIFIICSDGLSDKLSLEEIRDVAKKNVPEGACRQFIHLANERGGEDNITVIVAKVASARKSLFWIIEFIRDYIFKNKG